MQSMDVYRNADELAEAEAVEAVYVEACLAEERERIAKAVEAAGEGWKPERGPLGDGWWYAELYANFIRNC